MTLSLTKPSVGGEPDSILSSVRPRPSPRPVLSPVWSYTRCTGSISVLEVLLGSPHRSGLDLRYRSDECPSGQNLPLLDNSTNKKSLDGVGSYKVSTEFSESGRSLPDQRDSVTKTAEDRFLGRSNRGFLTNGNPAYPRVGRDLTLSQENPKLSH